MTEPRDRMLSEFRQGLEGIDPVLDRAADYGRGMKAVQGIVHNQGQVMSEALKNSAMLWEERKVLKYENNVLKADNERLKTRAIQMSERIEELERTIETSGGDRYKALYEAARKTLEQNLHDLLSPEQLRDKLDELKRQQAELVADGVPLPTTPSREAVDEHAIEHGLTDIL